MALNMLTDPVFDEALGFIAEKEHKTKSDIIRALVIEKCKELRGKGFRFGALSKHLKGKKPSSATILKELKAMDHDHDLD